MIKKSALSSFFLLVVVSLSLPYGVLALPPRPEPTPSAPPVIGGGIELRVYSPQTVDWDSIQTLVQWQDGLGGWHVVDGWRGTLDEIYADGGRKTWFVSEEHFGTGPFRWVLYADDSSPGEEPLATGEPFVMPESDGQLVRSVVTLP